MKQNLSTYTQCRNWVRLWLVQQACYAWSAGRVSKYTEGIPAFRKISEPVQLFILHLLLKMPGIYLHEITAGVKCTLGLYITESTVC